LNSDNIVTHNQILQKLKNYLKNKNDSEEMNDENENKNEELINTLKRAVLQSLLHLYREQKKKLIKKYFDTWRINSKKMMKYIKKVVPGTSTYKSQDKNLSNLSFNDSNAESNSSNVKQYYPKKTSKYSSIGKKKPDDDNNVSNFDNTNRISNNRNNNMLNTDDSLKKETHTYNPNTSYVRNISFGDLQQCPLDQSDNTSPNQILEKIKKRSEQYSNEYLSDIMDNNLESNHQKRVVSMIQRIQNIYRSPNQSIHSYNNSNVNSISNKNRSSKDIFNYQNQNYAFAKKKKKGKSKSKKHNREKSSREMEEQISDESSVNNSLMNGINLQETKVENLKPVIYTSQSFFIDKKTINENNIENNNNANANEISSISFYKHLNKKYPMKMKGDFRKLIEKNPEILKEKNPRIQVTNATCELEQFEERERNNIYRNDINLMKINPNINVKNKNKNKKKDLTKIVYNCDRDIYESQEPYEAQKQRWISMSIPLNNDKAKWEFLNGVKGERHKNNANKFDLIQKNKVKSQTNKNKVKLVERSRKKSKKDHSLSKIMEDPIENNVQYDLREMNFSQFYRSPVTTSRRDANSSFSPAMVKLVKKGNKKSNTTYNSGINSVNYARDSNYNNYKEESSNEY
jgi:hypothetical protein